MGFYPDMRRLQAYLPSRSFHTSMFSATFPPHVLRLAEQFLHQPKFLNLSGDQIHVSEIEHVFYTTPGMDKDRALVRIIEIENPASALIFCNTRARVHFVATVLQRFGYDADEISSDISQASRESIMERVRKGELRFLVATDVAARGIDLPDLSHVILYEPPEEPEAYIHRAGRTGRAGASGTAISLVNVLERTELQRIAKRYSIPIQERPLPADEAVEAVVSQRATALLEARLRERDNLKIERMQRFFPLIRSLMEEPEGTNLLATLVDDFYQEGFHGPIVEPPTHTQAPTHERPRSSGKRRPRNRPRRS
jgi:ATP-dependent RNA helicase DeaD